MKLEIHNNTLSSFKCRTLHEIVLLLHFDLQATLTLYKKPLLRNFPVQYLEDINSENMDKDNGNPYDNFTSFSLSKIIPLGR